MYLNLNYIYLTFIFFISANGMIIPLGRNFEIAQIIFIILFFFIIIQVIFNKKYTLKIGTKFFSLYILWILLMFLSILNKPETFIYTPRLETSRLQQYDLIGYMYIIWVILNFCVAIITYHFAIQKDMFIKIIRVLFIGSGVFSLYGIYQYLAVWILGSGAKSIVYILKDNYLFGVDHLRLSSFAREPLYYGNFLAIILVITIALTLSKKGYSCLKFNSYTFYLLFFINLTALFLTFSTGALVSLIGSSMIILFIKLFNKTDRIFKSPMNIILITVFIIGLLFSLSAGGFRVGNKIARLSDTSSGYGRIISILEAIEIIKDRPLTGIGLGNSIYFTRVRQIHNAYLNMAAETGLPSLFIFITIIYLIYKRVKKRYKESEYNKPIYLGLLGALFILLIQWLSFFAYMTTLAWFILGLLLAVPKVDEKHISAY